MSKIESYHECGFVARFTVSDMEKSIAWYESKLGLKLDPRFAGKYWNQLNFEGMPRFAIGLGLPSKHFKVGSGGAVTTIVVDDIKEAKEELERKEVVVSPIKNVGQGVQLAFFADPDGNRLGLRQNSPEECSAALIGWQAP